MLSHARNLFSPASIFGANKRAEDATAGAAPELRASKRKEKERKKRQQKRKWKGDNKSQVSTHGTDGAERQEEEEDEDLSGQVGAKIQNALNSSASGGGSSSGYTSQLSGVASLGAAPPPPPQTSFQAGSTTTTTSRAPRMMQNGDRNNNLVPAKQRLANSGTVHEQMYHSLASSSSHLARLPMVPMMIDDDDDNEIESVDATRVEEDEQAAEIDLDLSDDLAPEDLDHHLDHHRRRLRPHNFDQQQQQLGQHRSLRLIDGLRQQHEMRYANGAPQTRNVNGDQQRRHPLYELPHKAQLDDKLSLANSIMFQQDGPAPSVVANSAPHNHQHFSLPATTTTAECADSDATNSSTSRNFQYRHHLNHLQQQQHQYQSHLLAHSLRPHLRGGGELAPFDLYQQHNHHHQVDHHNHAIGQHPRHSEGARTTFARHSLGKSNHSHALTNNQQAGPEQHHHQSHLLGGASNGHLRSSSFLQFERPQQKPPPVPRSKPQTLLHLPASISQSYDQFHQYNNQHSRLNQEAGPYAQQSYHENFPNNHYDDTHQDGLANRGHFKQQVNQIRTLTHRMHPPYRTDATATTRHSNLHLAAPDTTGADNNNNQPQQFQQARRSKSNQQLGASPIRQQQQHLASPGKVHKSSSMMANGPAGVAASQINANLAAISSPSNGRRPRGHEHGERVPLVLSCCGKLAKFLLFIANVLFWSAGIALGAWGILALVEDHKYNLSQLLVFDSGTRMSLFQLLSWSFITLGCATILVGICGCSAMFKNSRWILGLYIFLILAIFALDLATGLLAMIFQERLVTNVRLRLVNKLRTEYGLQASFTAAIDYLQTRYECCGLEGHFDYDQSLWRLQRLGGFEATVARTCCHLRNTFDDQAHVNPRPVNESMCQSTDVRFHQSYRYRRGCLDDLERLIRHKIWTFTIGCGIVGGIILLSLALATCFCRSIPSEAKNGSKSSKKSSNGSASRKTSNRVHQQALAYVENVSKKQGQHHHSSSHYR